MCGLVMTNISAGKTNYDLYNGYILHVYTEKSYKRPLFKLIFSF